ncbi:MAG: thioredoxin domain-containing protein, partial [Rhodocyclales bacterium]|nr:thioredoxin domain-containing protein [Rhodocyclales bacterium]
RPILLSIGYSACHWCHVMAHESFEDAEVAMVMNRLFVNIKVDREERPDLDQIYQTAHQMLTRRAGGWPLTMFLAPDGTPFFGGTYFPREPRYGLPGFADLCERVADAYDQKREEITAQAAELRQALADTVPESTGLNATYDATPLTAAAASLARNFDSHHGGFGGAPKFPHPTDLAFLLRRPDPVSRRMALTTLTRMSEGGIYDQIGGGFCRYSVDERWEIPHFEKMLYDNGPLLALCADAWTEGREPLFARVAEETATWVLREMQSPDGGYYSSLDADSEGEEGKYYVWDRDQMNQFLTPQESALAARRWGFDGPPNFEGRHWHARVAGDLGVAERPLLESARRKLFAAREKRVRPGRDEKILTSWNALMIEGMAHAARVFEHGEWLASAQRAMDFLRATMWRDGRLLATARDGRAHLDAYLDDHAFLLA